MIKGYILLTRPVNLLIAFLAVFIGGFVTGSIQPLGKLLLACFSGMFISAGGCSINDYYDLEIDRINRPRRPLPSGMVSLKQAFAFSLILFGVGVVIALFIHLLGFLIALGCSFLLYFYSIRLKGTVIWGNITVAFITGLAFVYGGLAIGRIQEALIVGVFAFFFHWGREIIKDVEDMEGDRSVGIATLPIRFGVRVALCWATGVLVVLIGLTLIPYIMGIFSVSYLIVVTAGVDLFLVYVLISMWRKPVAANLGRLAVLMKADMLMGLLAVYLG
jgi:geranylgeranylglycerol-phosphate geranylgeranyltransferase